jgi:trehalose 6-phosphate phosphatase
MFQPDQHLSPPPPGQTNWAYFLDVDGTLISHTDNIDDVRVTPQLRALMHDLASCCNGALALVSGRRLSDLQTLFNMTGVTFIGQNGLEGHDNRGRTWQQKTFSASLRKRIHAEMKPMLALNPKLLLEDKGLMMTLHCRSVSTPNLQNLLLPSITPYPQKAMPLVLGLGKSGVDLMPCRYGKRQAVAWMLTQAPFYGRRPVFIGDDWADEPAFLEMNQRKGLSIKVGWGATHAIYRLENVAQVLAWLRTVPEQKAV